MKSFPRGLMTDRGEFAPILTAIDTYVTAGIWATDKLLTKHLVFTAATNNLHVRLMGSIDGGVTYPLTVEAEFTVAAAAVVSKTETVYVTHVKAEVKPAVGATHGTLTTQYCGASF